MPLLDHSHDILCNDVKDQAAGDRDHEKHAREHDGHQHHHALLGRISDRHRRHFLCRIHQYGHRDGKYEVRIAAGKVMKRAKPWRVAQFNRDVQHSIEPKPNGHLDHLRQAAAHGVDALAAVHRHDFLVHLLLARIAHGIFLIAVLDRANFRRHFLHLLHRPPAFHFQRVEHHVNGDGHDHNGPTVVRNEVIKPTKDVEEQKVAPEIRAIQDRYKKYSMRDPRKQEMNKEVMAVYSREGVNPMGSCLPQVIQMPIWFGLYRMLNVTIELRHAPWFG